jgi:hypothetical protein
LCLFAGCRSGYGVYVRGTSLSTEHAWKQQYVQNFACKQCPPGEVAFLPGSNLELVWDGETWTIQLIHDGQQSMTKKIAVRAAGIEPGTNASMLAATAAAADVAAAAQGVTGEEEFAAEVQGYAELTAAAVQSWYGKAQLSFAHEGGYVAPPVYPGQCVPCPEGSTQQGQTCKWLAC